MDGPAHCKCLENAKNVGGRNARFWPKSKSKNRGNTDAILHSSSNSGTGVHIPGEFHTVLKRIFRFPVSIVLVSVPTAEVGPKVY